MTRVKTEELRQRRERSDANDTACYDADGRRDVALNAHILFTHVALPVKKDWCAMGKGEMELGCKMYTYIYAQRYVRSYV
jgi:hypothetical protein